MMMVVCSKVVEGYILVDVLVEFFSVFDDFFCVMVVVGEKLGYFDIVFNCLVDYIECC